MYHKWDEKTALRMGENKGELSNWPGINRRNIQIAHAAQYPKNKQPNQKMGRRPKETFLQRRHPDGQEAHKKMLNITIREMQIKTTIRYYLKPVRMALIKKYKNNKCERGCGEEGTLLHCWWEGKLIQTLWSIVLVQSLSCVWLFVTPWIAAR